MAEENGRPWYRILTGYQWFVLIVCTLGWAFDTFDQQLFNVARQSAVKDLLPSPTPEAINQAAGWATAVMLIGWATGGIIFGMMGDRWGRAKTMILTILLYSLFTGLSAFSVGLADFLLYRFLAGLGIGGEFGLGTAMVAETLPDRARPKALGFLQAFSAFGNISAGLVGMLFAWLILQGTIQSQPWRWMFAVGIVPALLVVIIMFWLKEPEKWKQAVAEGKTRKHKAGSMVELFGDPRWRHRAIVGIILASAGVIGLWGIGVFGVDLVQNIFHARITQEYRRKGEAEQDRLLALQLFRNPEALETFAESGIQPRSLLTADPKDRDVPLLVAAALTLHAAGRPVTPEAALDLLDKGQTADGTPLAQLDGKRTGQTDEERKRREDLLKQQGQDAGPTLQEHIDRIRERNKQIDGYVARWGSMQLLLFNIGAFFGIYAFSMAAGSIGRRAAFAIFFVAALAATVVFFLFVRESYHVLCLAPLMGFCQLSVFGGYAIYFPELFPTRLRSTGTSMCYNIGRYVSAAGPAMLGVLSGVVFAGFEEPIRWAGVTMCAFYVIGLLILPFAPETKDQPLPE
ncbi:MAG: MFS transporter [Thermogutta sp.]|nr:MFS transporter [Thermogutta sp.]